MQEFLIFTGAAWALFGVLEYAFPYSPDQPIRREGRTTDWAYLVFNGVTERVVAPAFVLGVIGLAAWAFPRPGESWISAQPVWLQILALLLIGDLFHYWIHRALHATPFLWRVHSIHHSSTELDWLSASRSHPLDLVISVTLRAGLLYAVGFHLELIGPYVPAVLLLNPLIHSNVRWRFGWLGSVLVSPAWHREHHATQAGAGGHNFSGIFPVWDYLFGTARAPSEPVARFGLRDEERIPDRFWAQLASPWRAPKPH